MCITNTSLGERRVLKAVMFSDVVVGLKHFVDMKTEQSCSSNRPNHKAGSACLQRNHSPGSGVLLRPLASALREFQLQMLRKKKANRNASWKWKESAMISERGIAFVSLRNAINHTEAICNPAPGFCLNAKHDVWSNFLSNLPAKFAIN